MGKGHIFPKNQENKTCPNCQEKNTWKDNQKVSFFLSFESRNFSQQLFLGQDVFFLKQPARPYRGKVVFLKKTTKSVRLSLQLCIRRPPCYSSRATGTPVAPTTDSKVTGFARTDVSCAHLAFAPYGKLVDNFSHESDVTSRPAVQFSQRVISSGFPSHTLRSVSQRSVACILQNCPSSCAGRP